MWVGGVVEYNYVRLLVPDDVTTLTVNVVWWCSGVQVRLLVLVMLP